MNEKVSNKFNLTEIMMFCLLTLLCFQNVSLITIGGVFSFKLSHLFSLTFIPKLIKEKKINIPPLILTAFIFYIILISMVMSSQYGFNSLMFNYIFCFYILVIICTFGKKINKDKWLKIMKLAAWVAITAVYIKAIRYHNIIINFLSNPYGHPSLPTIFGGGVNLEATWLGLLGFAFFKDKKGIIYASLCFIISAIYASRVGIILVLMLFFFIIFQSEIKFTRKQIKRAFALIGLAIIIVGIIYNSGVLDYVIKRFKTTGTDSGSVGRLNMWEYVYSAFCQNPMGYGLGNCIKAIELVSGYNFLDGNLHNLIFQMLLDVGIIGMMYYILLLFYIFRKGIKGFLHNPFLAFLVSYFILSFMQFRGGDAIMFYVLGIYIVTYDNFKNEKNNNVLGEVYES